MFVRLLFLLMERTAFFWFFPQHCQGEERRDERKMYFLKESFLLAFKGKPEEERERTGEECGVFLLRS